MISSAMSSASTTSASLASGFKLELEIDEFMTFAGREDHQHEDEIAVYRRAQRPLRCEQTIEPPLAFQQPFQGKHERAVEDDRRERRNGELSHREVRRQQGSHLPRRCKTVGAEQQPADTGEMKH